MSLRTTMINNDRLTVHDDDDDAKM